MLQNNKILCIQLIHYAYRAAYQTMTSGHGKRHAHKIISKHSGNEIYDLKGM
jgi:hypothetical protein